MEINYNYGAHRLTLTPTIGVTTFQRSRDGLTTIGLFHRYILNASPLQFTSIGPRSKLSEANRSFEIFGFPV